MEGAPALGWHLSLYCFDVGKMSLFLRNKVIPPLATQTTANTPCILGLGMPSFSTWYLTPGPLEAIPNTWPHINQNTEGPHSIHKYTEHFPHFRSAANCKNWKNHRTLKCAQWFSTFLMLRPFNTVLRVMMPPDHKIISFLLHQFAAVVNCNVNAWYAGYLICNPLKEPWPTSWQTLSLWKCQRFRKERNPRPPTASAATVAVTTTRRRIP